MPRSASTHPAPSGRTTTRLRVALGVAGAATATAGALAIGPSAGAVIGGAPAGNGEYPSIVALTYDDGEVSCAGTILSAELVLTAAHCVVGEDPADITVEAGTNEPGDPDAQVRPVDDIRVHRDFEVNDVAVLHLGEPLDLNERVQPVALADAATQAALFDDGSPVVVVGWGATDAEEDEYPSTLLETDVVVVGDDRCATEYADELAEWGAELVGPAMVCANHPEGHDSCGGDSGGPLLARDPADDAWYQVGIVSFGITDCGETAGVYAEVAAFGDFIASGGTTNRDPDPDPALIWDDEEWDEGDEAWDEIDDTVADQLFTDPALAREVLDRAAPCAETGGIDCIDEVIDAVLDERLTALGIDVTGAD